MNYKEKLNELLLMTVRQNASDLHIGVGRRPSIRVDSVLIPIEKETVLTKEEAEGLVLALLTDEQRERFLKLKQLDFSYNYEDKARFRINVFIQRGFMAAALRVIFLKSKHLMN